MSRLGVFPIAVRMQRHHLQNRWVDESWSASEVVSPVGAAAAGTQTSEPQPDNDAYVVGGLELELFADEDDGYFENWAAPEPKVFVMWRMQQQRAIPVKATVSVAEGTRMLDSGEATDGVPMPQEVHAWLGEYLRMHYRPPARRQRR